MSPDLHVIESWFKYHDLRKVSPNTLSKLMIRHPLTYCLVSLSVKQLSLIITID